VLEKLVRLCKLRWRVERDYQEMKQEVRLDHFEGRSWRGFHHHATLCAVAHGFLVLRRALFLMRIRRGRCLGLLSRRKRKTNLFHPIGSAIDFDGIGLRIDLMDDIEFSLWERQHPQGGR